MDCVRESFRFQFVVELPELVDINARPKSERMRYRLRRGPSPSRGRLAQAGANGSIDGFLERDAEFARALLQEASQVVIERQGRPHA
jgi:hypothetical protein